MDTFWTITVIILGLVVIIPILIFIWRFVFVKATSAAKEDDRRVREDDRKNK